MQLLKTLGILSLFMWCNLLIGQQPTQEFDGSFSIVVPTSKMIHVELNQEELELVNSMRKIDERVVVKIRDFQVVILSENEFNQGVRFTKHTIQNEN